MQWKLSCRALHHLKAKTTCWVRTYALCVQAIQEQAEAQERARAIAEAVLCYRGVLQGDNLLGVDEEAYIKGRMAGSVWQTGQAKAVRYNSRLVCVCMCWAHRHHVCLFSYQLCPENTASMSC